MRRSSFTCHLAVVDRHVKIEASWPSDTDQRASGSHDADVAHLYDLYDMSSYHGTEEAYVTGVKSWPMKVDLAHGPRGGAPGASQMIPRWIRTIGRPLLPRSVRQRVNAHLDWLDLRLGRKIW